MSKKFIIFAISNLSYMKNPIIILCILCFISCEAVEPEMNNSNKEYNDSITKSSQSQVDSIHNDQFNSWLLKFYNSIEWNDSGNGYIYSQYGHSGCGKYKYAVNAWVILKDGTCLVVYYKSNDTPWPYKIRDEIDYTQYEWQLCCNKLNVNVY